MTYYSLWDRQCNRYMVTGLNSATKEELRKELLSYLDFDDEYSTCCGAKAYGDKEDYWCGECKEHCQTEYQEMNEYSTEILAYLNEFVIEEHKNLIEDEI